MIDDVGLSMVHVRSADIGSIASTLMIDFPAWKDIWRTPLAG